MSCGRWFKVNAAVSQLGSAKRDHGRRPRDQIHRLRLCLPARRTRKTSLMPLDCDSFRRTVGDLATIDRNIARQNGPASFGSGNGTKCMTMPDANHIANNRQNSDAPPAMQHDQDAHATLASHHFAEADSSKVRGAPRIDLIGQARIGQLRHRSRWSCCARGTPRASAPSPATADPGSEYRQRRRDRPWCRAASPSGRPRTGSASPT